MGMSTSFELTPRGSREIVVNRRFAAPRAAVFAALTQPELLRRWMLGPPGWRLSLCEVEPRAGGAFRYVWRNARGEEMGVSGVFRECEAPGSLVQTETFDEDWAGGESLVRITLTEAAGVTSIEETILYATREGRDGALGSGMGHGMAIGYDRLDLMLEGRDALGQ